MRHFAIHISYIAIVVFQFILFPNRTQFLVALNHLLQKIRPTSNFVFAVDVASQLEDTEGIKPIGDSSCLGPIAAPHHRIDREWERCTNAKSACADNQSAKTLIVRRV